MINRHRFILLFMICFSFSALCRNDIANYEVSPIKRIKLMGDINVVCVVDTINRNIVEYPDTLTDWENVLFLTIDHETLTVQTLERYRIETLLDVDKMKPLIINVASDLRYIENGYNSLLDVRWKIRRRLAPESK